MLYFGYMFLDDVDYLIEIVSCFIRWNSSPLEMGFVPTHLSTMA